MFVFPGVTWGHRLAESEMSARVSRGVSAAQVAELHACHPSGLQIGHNAENPNHCAEMPVTQTPRAKMAADEEHAIMFTQNGIQDEHVLSLGAP